MRGLPRASGADNDDEDEEDDLARPETRLGHDGDPYYAELAGLAGWVVAGSQLWRNGPEDDDDHVITER